jgi:hypothetical protein
MDLHLTESQNVINLPLTRGRMNRGNKYACQKTPGMSWLVVDLLPSQKGLY